MCTAIAGPLVNMVGNISNAWAGRSIHNTNADYYDQMAEMTNAQAEKAIDSVQYAAGMNSSRVRNQGLSMVKSQRAALAAHGISSNSITYGKIIDDTVSRSEKDAIAIQYNADVQSANIRANAIMKAGGMRASAISERAAGDVAWMNGLLSAGSQFAGMWAKWSDTSRGGNEVNKTISGNTNTPDVKMFNTDFYTGTPQIDFNKDRYDLMNGVGYKRDYGFSWR